MWPFTKPIIEVECSLPSMLQEDQDYICRGILEDLDDEFGFCYNIRLKTGDINKVSIINGRKNKQLEERAIRIEMHRRIKNLK